MPRTARRTYGVNRDSWTVLADILTGRTVNGDYEYGPVDFNPDTASLRGRNERNPDTGRMPEEDARILRGHRQAGGIRYVIYSYNTPIAYLTVGMAQGRGVSKWIVPDARYSVTTSKHQGRVRPAVARASERGLAA